MYVHVGPELAAADGSVVNPAVGDALVDHRHDVVGRPALAPQAHGGMSCVVGTGGRRDVSRTMRVSPSADGEPGGTPSRGRRPDGGSAVDGYDDRPRGGA